MKLSLACLLFVMFGGCVLVDCRTTDGPTSLPQNSPLTDDKTAAPTPSKPTAAKTTFATTTPTTAITKTKATTAKTTQHSATTRPSRTTATEATTPRTTQHPVTTRPSRTTATEATTAKTTQHPVTTQPNRTTATKVPGRTTTAAGNTTNTTTARLPGTTAVTSPPDIPSFQFKHNNSEEVCMLFVLNAALKIKYNTTSGETDEVLIPMSAINITAVGDCEGSVSREFNLVKRGEPINKTEDYVAAITLHVYNTNDGSYTIDISAFWYYDPPFFPHDAVKFDKSGFEITHDVLSGTIGKTLKCKRRTFTKGPVTFILDSMMLQPYADFSKDKGHFGEVENCDAAPTTSLPTGETTSATREMRTTARPTPTAKPVNVGMIIGIVIGVLGAVIGVCAALYAYYWHRKYSKAYGNLDCAEDKMPIV